MRRNAKDLGNDVAVEVDLPSPGGDERVEDGAGAEGGEIITCPQSAWFTQAGPRPNKPTRQRSASDDPVALP